MGEHTSFLFFVSICRPKSSCRERYSTVQKCLATVFYYKKETHILLFQRKVYTRGKIVTNSVNSYSNWTNYYTNGTAAGAAETVGAEGAGR